MMRHAAWMLPAALLALSCSNQTAGNPFQVPFSISGLERPDAGPLLFTTPLNWAVQLDAAQIYLGPFYFNIDPPEQGVYRSGVVTAQSLLQVTVDTLNPSLVPVPGGVNGETGTSIGPAVAVELRPVPTGRDHYQRRRRRGRADGLGLCLPCWRCLTGRRPGSVCWVDCHRCELSDDSKSIVVDTTRRTGLCATSISRRPTRC